MPQPLRINPLLDTDSYKETHPQVLPKTLTEAMNYYCNRGGIYSEMVFFGLQAQLIREFEGKFFTQQDLDEAYEDSQVHFYDGFPYPKAEWQYILDKYDGRLPLEIRAIKEGRPFNISNNGVNNVVFTVKSTDPKCAWLPGWAETRLMRNWYGSIVATQSREVKKLAKEYLALTADSDAGLPFMLHDFGARAVSCTEQAAAGGGAHLINFLGTDTKIGMSFLHQYYGAPRVCGHSVPATEHQIMTMEGPSGEPNVVGRILEVYKDAPILSMVIDSYDDEYFVREIMGGIYRDQILHGKTKVVARPDSGDPSVKVPLLLDILADRFGYSVNSKGYKVLSPCVGLLWGDGMDIFSIRKLYETLQRTGWSVENVVVGMGGGLLHKGINRDTSKAAMKFCNVVLDGVDTPVWKAPKGDPTKASFKGRPALIYSENTGLFSTVQDVTGNGVYGDQLELVFRNGVVLRHQTLDEIRKLAEV
jgi:nicotinamide phosphoribosyltransferase